MTENLDNGSKVTSGSVSPDPQDFFFDLNEEMIERLRKEFDPSIVIDKFAQSIHGKNADQINTIAEKMFKEYGQEWMEKTIQLGEEYSDRTYEVLKKADEQTGEYFFPHVLQRFIEIAYLSTQKFLKLPIPQNWSGRLIYRVPDCHTFNIMEDKCGTDVAEDLHCRHACLTAANTACSNLNLDTTVRMETTMVKNKFCQFVIERS